MLEQDLHMLLQFLQFIVNVMQNITKSERELELYVELDECCNSG